MVEQIKEHKHTIGTNTSVRYQRGNAFIPVEPANKDYRKMLQDIAEGRAEIVFGSDTNAADAVRGPTIEDRLAVLESKLAEGERP